MAIPLNIIVRSNDVMTGENIPWMSDPAKSKNHIYFDAYHMNNAGDSRLDNHVFFAYIYIDYIALGPKNGSARIKKVPEIATKYWYGYIICEPTYAQNYSEPNFTCVKIEPVSEKIRRNSDDFSGMDTYLNSRNIKLKHAFPSRSILLTNIVKDDLTFEKNVHYEDNVSFDDLKNIGYTVDETGGTGGTFTIPIRMKLITF